jgi:hypothetical protein
MRIDDLPHARDGGVRSRARIITHMDFINIPSLDPASSIELVILYCAVRGTRGLEIYGVEAR